MKGNPTSINQQRHIDVLSSSSHFSQGPILTFGFLIKKNFETCRFVDATEKVVMKHPGLRVSFSKTGDLWHQSIADSVNIAWKIYELDNANDVHGTLLDKAKNFCSTPLNFVTDPIIRACIVVGYDSAGVVFQSHHAYMDGYSIMIFVGDLLQLYHADNEDRNMAPAVIRQSFVNIASEQKVSLESEGSLRKVKYWVDLIGRHPMRYEYMGKRKNGTLRTVTTNLSSSLLCRSQSASKSMSQNPCYLIMLAFLEALADYRSEAELLVNIVNIGRSGETVNTIGDFADLEIVAHNSGRKTKQACTKLEENVKFGRKFRIPYWHLVKHISIQAYETPQGLTPYLFNYIPFIAPPTNAESNNFEWITDFDLPNEPGVWDIACRVIALTDTASIMEIHYNDTLLSKDDATEFLSNFLENVDTIVTNIEESIVV